MGHHCDGTSVVFVFMFVVVSVFRVRYSYLLYAMSHSILTVCMSISNQLVYMFSFFYF